MKKKMTLIAYVFPTLETAKDLLKQMSKKPRFWRNFGKRHGKRSLTLLKSRFRRPYDKQHGKWSQTLLISARKHVYHICWSLWRKISWEKPPLVIYNVLGPFVKKLTADDKHFLVKSDNLTQAIQMQLSKKQKLSLNCFLHFWNLD